MTYNCNACAIMTIMHNSLAVPCACSPILCCFRKKSQSLLSRALRGAGLGWEKRMLFQLTRNSQSWSDNEVLLGPRNVTYKIKEREESTQYLWDGRDFLKLL